MADLQLTRLNFSPQTKRKAYDRDGGKCRECGCDVPETRAQYDHILPDALGGKPELANCQLLCGPCHKEKTAQDVGRIRKADRQRARHVGAMKPKGTIKNAGFAKRQRKHKGRQSLLPISLYEAKS